MISSSKTYPKIRSCPKSKARNSSNIAYLLWALSVIYVEITAARTAMSEELWPAQPNPPVVSNPWKVLQGSPPFKNGQRFYAAGGTSFFRRRSDLDAYLKDKENLPEMVASGAVMQFAKGRSLQAREDITSYAGRVYDQELGDGYAIIETRF